MYVIAPQNVRYLAEGPTSSLTLSPDPRRYYPGRDSRLTIHEDSRDGVAICCGSMQQVYDCCGIWPYLAMRSAMSALAEVGNVCVRTTARGLCRTELTSMAVLLECSLV